MAESLNPEDFDILDYLRGVPLAEETHETYTDVGRCRQLTKLMNERDYELAQRREAEKKGDNSSLSLADEDEDTRFDDEINGLIEELEKTKMVFTLRSVAPEKRKVVEATYNANIQPDWTQDQLNENANFRVAEVLSMAIVSVRVGDHEDTKPWDRQRLLDLEKNLYEAQAKALINKLNDLVYTGQALEDAVTLDFS